MVNFNLHSTENGETDAKRLGTRKTMEKSVAIQLRLDEEINTNGYKKPYEISQSITHSLETLFPEQKFDKTIQKAREILGLLANEFTPEQLKDVVMEIQYLTDSWLDEYERELFNGKTLRELLHEKGGT